MNNIFESNISSFNNDDWFYSSDKFMFVSNSNSNFDRFENGYLIVDRKKQQIYYKQYCADRETENVLLSFSYVPLKVFTFYVNEFLFIENFCFKYIGHENKEIEQLINFIVFEFQESSHDYSANKVLHNVRLLYLKFNKILIGDLELLSDRMHFSGIDENNKDVFLEIELNYVKAPASKLFLSGETSRISFQDICIVTSTEKEIYMSSVIRYFMNAYQENQSKMDSEILKVFNEFYQSVTDPIEMYEFMFGFYETSTVDILLVTKVMAAFETIVKFKSGIQNRKIFNADNCEYFPQGRLSVLIEEKHKNVAMDYYIKHFEPLLAELVRLFDGLNANSKMIDSFGLFVIYKTFPRYCSYFLQQQFEKFDIEKVKSLSLLDNLRYFKESFYLNETLKIIFDYVLFDNEKCMENNIIDVIIKNSKLLAIL